MDLVRKKALEILYEIDKNGAYMNIALSNGIADLFHQNNESKKGFTGLDAAFITEIVTGVTRYKKTIDFTLIENSKVALKKLSPWVLNIIRMGIYQILYMSKVPHSAACDEAVKLTKKYNFRSTGYVNAVLRNISRANKAILDNINNIDLDTSKGENKKKVDFLSLKYAFPEWMVNKWLDNFGYDFTEALLTSLNVEPDTCIRINNLKTDKKSVEKYLENSNIDYEEAFLDECLEIKKGVVSRGEALEKGWYYIQDKSSMLVSKIAAPKKGNMVIDLCSAPGGKSTHMAQLMENDGKIISCDVFEHKLNIIKDNCNRLGVNIIETIKNDASILNSEWKDYADIVLVDAPCTGLGIIRRKPDIKWSRKAEDTLELAKLQKSILQNAAEYVKIGGELVYSTCTIEKEENIDIIKDFLKRNKNFKPVDFSEDIPEKLAEKSVLDGYLQLYPNVHNTDGFFIAKMNRIE